MSRDGLTESRAGKWTRADEYVVALAHKRGFRRRKSDPARTEPEAPRPMLSTIPFLALLCLLGVVALAIIVAAIPTAPAEREPQRAEPQRGVAAKGWFQEAQKEFHR